MELSLSMSGSSSSSDSSSGSSSSGSSSEDEDLGSRTSMVKKQNDSNNGSSNSGAVPEPPSSPPPPPPSSPPRPPGSPPPPTTSTTKIGKKAVVRGKPGPKSKAKATTPATTSRVKAARKAPAKRGATVSAKRKSAAADDDDDVDDDDDDDDDAADTKVRAVRKKPPARRKAAASAKPMTKASAPLKRRNSGHAMQRFRGDDEEEDRALLHATGSGRDEDDEFLDNLDDELDDYSGESDVFEDDIEALLYHEQAQEKAMGLANYTIEVRSATSTKVEYAYPRYLSKLPEILHGNAVFGRNPTQYIYCNNLLVRAHSSPFSKTVRNFTDLVHVYSSGTRTSLPHWTLGTCRWKRLN